MFRIYSLLFFGQILLLSVYSLPLFNISHFLLNITCGSYAEEIIVTFLVLPLVPLHTASIEKGKTPCFNCCSQIGLLVLSSKFVLAILGLLFWFPLNAAPLSISYSAHYRVGLWLLVLYSEDTLSSFAVNIVMRFLFCCLVALSVFIWGVGEFENYAAVLIFS